MQVQLQWRILSWMLAFTLLFGVGCNKKKPSVPPAQAQAPTIQQPTPEQTPPPSTSTATPPAPETSTTASTNPPAEKPSPSTPKKSTGNTHRHHPSTTKKSTPATPAPSTPPTPPANDTVAKASIPAPETAVGQISPDMSKSAASQAQQSTTELLDSTEKNLRGLTRSLSNDEQNTVMQIRSYVTQARLALKDQDLERAHNLALKAHQLSDVLVKQ